MIVLLELSEMDFMRKLSFLVFLLCVLISLRKENAETKKGFQTINWSSSDSASIFADPSSMSRPMISSTKLEEIFDHSGTLEYDFYRQSCPQAENIIRSRVRNLYQASSDIAPALLRLLFHDCFIEGCDASVLLDAGDGVESEKDSPPNETLKGYDLIDIIKSDVEEPCPRTVSCADIVVLAARESVVLSGGPFYPLQTGRRDSTLPFPEVATYELPTPQDDLPSIVESFSSRGFDEREIVSLLGAHSIGTIHCRFFLNRLYNFDGTDEPDPTVDVEFLNHLRSRCNNSDTSVSSSPSLSPSSADGSPSPSSDDGSLSSSAQEPGVQVDNEGRGSGFGTSYYRRLLQARGILYVDQQLTAGAETETWVRAYASDASLFQRDFAMAMTKLSNLRVLTSPLGQVRSSCSKVA